MNKELEKDILAHEMDIAGRSVLDLFLSETTSGDGRRVAIGKLVEGVKITVMIEREDENARF